MKQNIKNQIEKRFTKSWGKHELSQIKVNDELIKKLLTELNKSNSDFEIDWYWKIRDKDGLSIFHSLDSKFKEKFEIHNECEKIINELKKAKYDHSFILDYVDISKYFCYDFIEKSTLEINISNSIVNLHNLKEFKNITIANSKIISNVSISFYDKTAVTNKYQHIIKDLNIRSCIFEDETIIREHKLENLDLWYNLFKDDFHLINNRILNANIYNNEFNKTLYISNPSFRKKFKTENKINEKILKVFLTPTSLSNNQINKNGLIIIDFANLYNLSRRSLQELEELEKEGKVKFGEHNQKYRFSKSIHLPIKQEYQTRIKELNEILVHYIQKLTSDSSFAVEFESFPDEIIATFTSNEQINDDNFLQLREDFFKTFQEYIAEGKVVIEPHYLEELNQKESIIAQHEIYLDLFTYCAKLKVTQSISGVLGKEEEIINSAQQALLQGSSFSNCTIVLGNMEKVDANNSQLSLNSSNVNQSTTNIDQLIQEFKNINPPADPSIQKEFYSLKNIAESLQNSVTKEQKITEKLKSFSKAAGSELYSFAKGVGANVLAAVIQQNLGIQ